MAESKVQYIRGIWRMYYAKKIEAKLLEKSGDPKSIRVINREIRYLEEMVEKIRRVHAGNARAEDYFLVNGLEFHLYGIGVSEWCQSPKK
jgi:hypothetical protein